MRPHPLVCAPDALIRKLGAQPRFLTQVAGIQLPLWVGVKKQLESGVKQDLNLGTATWEEAIPSSVLIARSNKLSDKTSPTFLETKLSQCFFKSSFVSRPKSKLCTCWVVLCPLQECLRVGSGGPSNLCAVVLHDETTKAGGRMPSPQLSRQQVELG